MPAPTASDINRFLHHRQPGWRKFEALLERTEAQGLLALSPLEIREFGILYRRASSDLVSARAKTANAEVLDYLNDLVARGYSQVYCQRRHRVRGVWDFIARDFPRLVRRRIGPIAVATSIFAAASVFGFVAQRLDPPAAYYMLPEKMAGMLPGRGEELARRPGQLLGPNEMLAGSTFLFTHNIGVAFEAFAGGIAFGIGSIIAMLANGFLLGIFAAALNTSPKAALAFWSLILPHGIIELTAIFIAGGAGLMLGRALLAPGTRTRRDALLEQGRPAVLLVLGTIPMFICAGLIEGCITPAIWIPPAAKLAFAGLTLVGLVAYFTLPGRRVAASALEEMAEF